ncbi:hypothetical protein EGM_12483, partial [Macaca fascicularis]
ASRGPATASRPPPQAQLSLVVAPTGPAPASKQPPSFHSAPAQLLAALVGLKPSPVQISRPSSCLAVAFPGPDLASQWPGEAQLLPDNGLSRPSSCLVSASPGHVSACLAAALCRPSSSLTTASLPPAPFS